METSNLFKEFIKKTKDAYVFNIVNLFGAIFSFSIIASSIWISNMAGKLDWGAFLLCFF